MRREDERGGGCLSGPENRSVNGAGQLWVQDGTGGNAGKKPLEMPQCMSRASGCSAGVRSKNKIY